MRAKLAIQVLVLVIPMIFAAGGVQGGGYRDPPNVLIIMTDDQRLSDTMEFMPKTLKWFSEGGTDYTNAFAVDAICCPARAGVWTGQYVHNHRVFTTADAAALDEDASIQRYLHEEGYKTGAFGKFFNSYALTRTPKHLDDWAFHQSGYTNVAFNDHGVRRTVAYSPRFIEDRASDFLASTEANDGQPWYLYLTPYAPHSPWIAEEKYKDVEFPPWAGNPATLEADRSDKPQHMQSTVPGLSAKSGFPFDDTPEAVGTLGQVSTNVPFDRQIYLRTLLTVDDIVDGIMTQLEAQGELDNTFAIFMSDQGLLWGEHGWYNKMVPYTEAIQIPFFVRYPAGHLPAGVTDDRIVSAVDILPTILDITDIKADPAKQHDGRSFLSREPHREYALVEFFAQGLPSTGPVPTWATIRSHDWQYVEYYNASGGASFKEYYDLGLDRWQLDNVLSEATPLLTLDANREAELAGLLAAARACRGDAGPKVCP